MVNLSNDLNPPLDPSIIDNSPDALPDETNNETEDSKDKIISELRYKNAKLQDDRDAALSEITVSSQKARLLIPFSNKVFCFVAGYWIVAVVIIMLDGYKGNKFDFPDGVLTLLAGSTTVSIIGLLASIVTGIFRSD